MPSIPLLSGVYANARPDFRTAYPVNLVPVPMGTGISGAYLRPADGFVAQSTGPGVCRGGINWNGALYRVMGTSLVRVDPEGLVTVIGDVGDGGPVAMDYSFDWLAVASGTTLYLSNGSTVTPVVDPDIGVVNDVCWIDGYFMTTDGEFLVVTELTDPFSVKPLKYASSEADPDPIIALQRLRNEVAALNRYTIEYFDNVGGVGFPFQRIEGAQVQKGAVGGRACSVFVETIAFVGSGRNEAPGVYLASNANANKISTREIDLTLASYTEVELSEIVVENRNDGAHEHLYVHLPDRTLVYDHTATQAAGAPVWFVLTSALQGFSTYRARYMVWAYDRWNVGDVTTGTLGYMTEAAGSHFGSHVRWEFTTPIAYNEGRGIVFNQLELVALTGANGAKGADGASGPYVTPPGGSGPAGPGYVEPTIATSYSLDGVSWSVDRSIKAGRQGERQKRLAWFHQGHMRNWRVQRFTGDTRSNLAFASLQATIEPLAY